MGILSAPVTRMRQEYLGTFLMCQFIDCNCLCYSNGARISKPPPWAEWSPLIRTPHKHFHHGNSSPPLPWCSNLSADHRSSRVLDLGPWCCKWSIVHHNLRNHNAYPVDHIPGATLRMNAIHPFQAFSGEISTPHLWKLKIVESESNLTKNCRNENEENNLI